MSFHCPVHFFFYSDAEILRFFSSGVPLAVMPAIPFRLTWVYLTIHALLSSISSSFSLVPLVSCFFPSCPARLVLVSLGFFFARPFRESPITVLPSLCRPNSLWPSEDSWSGPHWFLPPVRIFLRLAAFFVFPHVSAGLLCVILLSFK